jgi:hypothetical protein
MNQEQIKSIVDEVVEGLLEGGPGSGRYPAGSEKNPDSKDAGKKKELTPGEHRAYSSSRDAYSASSRADSGSRERAGDNHRHAAKLHREAAEEHKRVDPTAGMTVNGVKKEPYWKQHEERAKEHERTSVERDKEKKERDKAIDAFMKKKG